MPNLVPKSKESNRKPHKKCKISACGAPKNTVLHFPRSQCFQHTQKVFLSSSEPWHDLESVTKHCFSSKYSYFFAVYMPIENDYF